MMSIVEVLESESEDILIMERETQKIGMRIG